ncbi:hypothetical protein FA13DRAFT_1738323 [Coprinellus micaceus]|uniref:Uncharacterized protein n=1 Tax=Coprinellus micaceus TaxID=71717 RepID=A0A4Y7SUC2_COPMI|nr:hypothetical protein FA13DRAFT_1738323 [Coprinellus micaceus]
MNATALIDGNRKGYKAYASSLPRIARRTPCVSFYVLRDWLPSFTEMTDDIEYNAKSWRYHVLQVGPHQGHSSTLSMRLALHAFRSVSLRPSGYHLRVIAGREDAAPQVRNH